MSDFEELKHLRIPLEEIKLATNNFSAENFLGKGGFGPVYKGELSSSQTHRKVAVKRLDSPHGQGQREFLTEIALLSSCEHENLVSLVGFCDESGEKLLVYKLESRGSLDKYLSSTDLSWMQRLQICIGAARGLSYLHNDVASEHRIIHRDIKSSNVLLDDDWEAKISDFGLSKIGPSNQQFTFLVSNACGTMGYLDPQYMKTGILTKESDVYSFGVLLFEVLCGRPAMIADCDNERRFLARLVHLRYDEGRLDEIVMPHLKEQMTADSMYMFADSAFNCLNKNRRLRPKMWEVVEDLEKALEFHLVAKNIKLIGPWSTKSGYPWSFHLKSNHKLRKITVKHGYWVVFLIFTTEDCNGQLHTSERIGGKGQYGGEIDEVNLDSDEKLIGISGKFGPDEHYMTSISFITSKTTHGPFGEGDGVETFSIPFGEGEFVGCRGRACWAVDSIGCYIKTME